LVALVPLAIAPAAFGERFAPSRLLRSARASRNLRTALLFVCERAARKRLRGNESEAQHALPDDGKRAQQRRTEVMAMAINKVILIGNLGANPDICALPSGQNVANFSLATTERFRDRNGAKQERTDWHRIVAFGQLADTCDRLLSKGRQVYVEGRLNTRQYEAKDGSGKRYRTEIIARQLRLLGNRADTPKAEASDDIPF
jgi:single-strand DNA-binding protein